MNRRLAVSRGDRGPFGWSLAQRLGLVVGLAMTALAAGCGESPLVAIKGELRLSETRIEFPRTFVGYSSVRKLTLSNGWPDPRPMSLTVQAPFDASPKETMVRGHFDFPIEVVFAPEGPGRFEQVMELLVDGAPKTVTLVGVAEKAPPCRASGPCREVDFNPETGECKERRLPDGASCVSGNQCMTDETCSGDVCKGVLRVCDDGNLCTEDVCDPARGCLALDRSADCPMPNDSCKSAYCDPLGGCGIVNVDDGTPCGPANCATALICASGQCRELDVPEGTPCNGECGIGACKDKVCFRTMGKVLKEAWTYEPDAGIRLEFPGISDPSGNLYWAECDSTSCDVVSYTSNGFSRFRSKVKTAVSGGLQREQLILVGEWIVVLTDRAIEAFSRVDGALAWERLLADDLEPILSQGLPCKWSAGSLASDGRGGIYAFFAGAPCMIPGTDALGPNLGVLFSLQAGTGEPIWSRIFEDNPKAAPLVISSDGSALVSFITPWLPGMVRVDRDGVVTSLLSVQDGAALASWGDLAFDDRSRAMRIADGAIAYQLPAFTTDDPPAFVIGTHQGFLLGKDGDGLRLSSFHPSTGFVSSTSTIEGDGFLRSWTHPILTNRDSALFAATFVGGGAPTETGFWEIGGDGDLLRSCVLPDAGLYAGISVLRQSSFTVTSRSSLVGMGPDKVHQFELPKGESGTAGWVNVRGSLAADGRPQ